MRRDPLTPRYTSRRYTNQGYVLSLMLHAGIIALAWAGLPFFHRELPVETPPLIIDLVPMEDITSAPPPPAPQPSPEPAPIVPPEPNLAATPPSADNMPPPPKFEIAKAEPKPEPKTPPPPKPNTAKSKQEDVALLQKLLKDMQKNAPKEQPKAPESKAEPSNNIAPNIADHASMTELDAIRRHIEGCWRIDPGKEGVENLSVLIKVSINPDGSVRGAEIVDLNRYLTDNTFRTFANSARNAVLGCGNIPISAERYELFKEIEMNFSPQGRIN